MNPEQWIKLEQQGRAVMAQCARDNHAAAAFASLRRLASKLPQTPAVLAGHPRSGTTLLEQVLASHSAVTDVDEKDALACALRETLSSG